MILAFEMLELTFCICRTDNLRVHMKIHGDPSLLQLPMEKLLASTGDHEEFEEEILPSGGTGMYGNSPFDQAAATAVKKAQLKLVRQRNREEEDNPTESKVLDMSQAQAELGGSQRQGGSTAGSSQSGAGTTQGAGLTQSQHPPQASVAEIPAFQLAGIPIAAPSQASSGDAPFQLPPPAHHDAVQQQGAAVAAAAVAGRAYGMETISASALMMMNYPNFLPSSNTQH